MPINMRHAEEKLWVAAGLLSFILIWSTAAGFYPRVFLPSPLEVLARLPDLWRQDYISHVWITMLEAGSGFMIGLAAALPLGTLMARWHWLERLISPYVIGAQAVPIVALAPLLILWFGTGILPKVLVAALVAFFPILTNVTAGLKNIDQRFRELFTIMGADAWQQWRLLDIPAALPVVFAGLRLGLTLSVIGAVVGEFAGADRGLGFLVNYARGLFDTPLMFLALLLLAGIGIAFYFGLVLLERMALPWRNQP